MIVGTPEQASAVSRLPRAGVGLARLEFTINRPIGLHRALPFHHVPVAPSTELESEEPLLEVVDEHRADLVVLARYMQVLSDATCSALHGRAINIHHSFLPGSKGAKPVTRPSTAG